jgi:hypothetical protein
MDKQVPVIKFGVPPLVIEVPFTGDAINSFWNWGKQRLKTHAAPVDFGDLFRPYTEKEASAVLNTLYLQYLERPLDDVGRGTYLPRIKNFGYSGIVSVSQELMQSGEMNEKVERNLRYLYQKYLHREPDDVGRAEYDKWIRFFGALGRQHVEKSISESAEATQVRAQK